MASRVYPHQARFLVHAPADTVRRADPGVGGRGPAAGRRSAARCSAAPRSLDFVLMHVVLLGHDFEVLDPPELAERCRVLAERLARAGAAS